MDFNFKKLARDAGTALSRVVQLTEEKLGTSERTELDAHFENLAERSDTTKLWTEKMLANTEAVLTPNPGNRVEDYLFDKIDKKRPNRLSNLEYLGLDMIDAGQEFGPGTAYGSALIKVGQCEQKLGTTERDFITSASHCLITPLRKFLEGEMKTIIRERSLLETKRLDLDACKNRVRKARSMLGTQNKEGPSPEVLLRQAEQDLRVAQSEFDRQAEITKLLLEGISSSHASHLRCLHEFVETQVRYYSQCHQLMQDLQRDLASDRKPSPMLRINSEEVELVPPENSSTSSPHLAPAIHMPHNEGTSMITSSAITSSVMTSSGNASGSSSPRFGRRARVLCDYDARDPSELSLMADEVINVRDPGGEDTDYFIGERGAQKGRVPRAFLEVFD